MRRTNAISLGANVRSEHRVEALLAKLASPDVLVAVKAEQLLASVSCPRGIEKLLAASRHDNPAVRLRVAWILGETQHPRFFSALARLSRDHDGRVAYESLAALGRLGARRAIPLLIRRINRCDSCAGTDNAAANALANLGTKAVPALLRNLRRGTRAARAITAAILGGIADHRAMKPLTRLLHDRHPEMRQAAVDALGCWGEQHDRIECRALIEPARLDPSQRVRETARFWWHELSLRRTALSRKRRRNRRRAAATGAGLTT